LVKDLRKMVLDKTNDIEVKKQSINNPGVIQEIESIKTLIQSNKKSLEINIRQLGTIEQSIESIKLAQLKIVKLKEEIKDYSDEVKPYRWWQDNLPEFKRWIIEGFLPELEELTNHYLTEINTDFEVKFNTVKEKKSKAGEFKQEFHISIIDESSQERTMQTFSTGEKKRIAICTGFALRQLTLNRGSNNFQFLMIDEVIDSLDKVGVEEFSHIIDTIPGLKIIVSHNDEIKDNFGNLIRVTKTEGTSIIEQL